MHPPEPEKDSARRGAASRIESTEIRISIGHEKSDVKRAIFTATKHWLAHGSSDFEAQRIRVMGSALAKGAKR